MLGDRSAHVVDFDGSSDPLHPHNWPPQKRLSIATPVCLSTLIATLGCALFAPATNEISAHFSLAQQTTLLGTSLYVLGFALGPLVFAPASELIGRRTPLVAGMLGCAILSLAAGAANDAQTLLITRFFAGAFGASPLCVVPAMLADLYSDGARGTAIAIYALAIFAGPFAGPFVGGFIVANPSMGWRWTQSFPAILGAANVVAVLCFVDDTSAPFLLVRKAAILRWETGIWSLHEEQERLELDWRAIGQKYFLRPLRLLALEPIVLSISIFMSFIYCPLYALMKGCPYAFGDIRGMGPGVAGLPLLAILFGQVLALCLIVGLKMCERRDVDLEKAAFGTKNRGVAPENGLLPAVIGAPVSSIGLLRFAWTAGRPTLHWMLPVASGMAIDFGLFCVWLPCFNYLVDAFTPIAASTVAGNIMLRSATAAGFPLFAQQMFEKLGVQWAGTILACISIVMIPIPVLFKLYGGRFRDMSRALAAELDPDEASERFKL